MRLRRILAMGRKEFLHVLRDPRSLTMALAIPVLLLVLFGSALTLDVDRVPLALWDQSGTPESRDLAERFGASRYFRILLWAGSPGDLERAIDSGHVLAALVIPRDFAGDTGAGRPARVQFIVDGSDSNTATIALGYAEAVVQERSLGIALQTARRQGIRPPRPPLELRPRVWFNTDLESRNYIIPGLIAMILMVIAALLTSLTVAREWERGTMEQLIATPVRRGEILLGKFLPYFAIGLVDVGIAVLMGEFVFQVPLRGSVALLFALAAVFLTGALCMGMLISIATRSQLVASQLAMLLTFVPAFLLSGFVFPITNMPRPVQLVTYLIPARYFIEILKGIYLKGVGLEILAAEAGLLAVFAAAMVLLARKKFLKKLVQP